MNFQDWKELKKVKDHDMLFLNSLKSPLQQAVFQRAADHLAQLNPSFSDGLRLLEMMTDLILMGHSEELFAKSDSFQSWSEDLKALRFPATTARDLSLKTKLESLQWPHGSKAKFERRGDRAGVELKLFISSPTDLDVIVSALERVKLEMKT